MRILLTGALRSLDVDELHTVGLHRVPVNGALVMRHYVVVVSSLHVRKQDRARTDRRYPERMNVSRGV